MHKGIMGWFRLSRRLPSLALLLAILAPVLFGIMPVPAMSAEQQLINDISGSICSPLGHSDTGERAPAQHEHCCILCGPLNHVLGTAGTPALAIAPSLKLRGMDIALSNSEAPPSPPDLRATAPRGPPTI